jgi:ABC-type maltose transport system permease subunit
MRNRPRRRPGRRTLVTLPIMVLFVIFQRSFVASVANSGIKG